MTCQSDAAACHESLDPCPILCPASSFDVLFNWCGGVDRWVSFLEQLGRGIKVPVVMEIVSFDHCQLSFVGLVAMKTIMSLFVEHWQPQQKTVSTFLSPRILQIL